MSFAESVILLIVAVLAGLGIYLAVKAHLHGVSLAAELKNQGGKVSNLEQAAADKAKAELEALKAKISPPAPPAP